MRSPSVGIVQADSFPPAYRTLYAVKETQECNFMFGIFACWVFQKPGFNQFSFVQDENELLDIYIHNVYIFKCKEFQNNRSGICNFSIFNTQKQTQI